MMGCITILEEENERLLEAASQVTDEPQKDEIEAETEAPAANNEETAALQSKISELEEEMIKKDVAFAQLQDEFSSMESEYLSMYEAMQSTDG